MEQIGNDGVSLGVHLTPVTPSSLTSPNLINASLISLADLNTPITDFANAGPNASQVLIPGAAPGDSKSIHNVGVNLATGTLRPETGVTPTYTNVTTSVAGNLTLVLDESSALPASMANALAYAATYLDKVITNPVAITLQVSAGSLGTGVLGEGSDHGYYMSLAKVDKYIANADPSIASMLPTSLPTGVYGQIQVAVSEAKAWGVPASYFASQGRNYTVAGSLIFNNASAGALYYGTGVNQGRAGTPGANQFDFFGLALHELTHAMGRISANDGTQTASGSGVVGYVFSPLNLFRFASPGTLQVDGVKATNNTLLPYFSVNDGRTNLSYFASPSRTDWGQSAAAQDAGGTYHYVGKAPAPIPGYLAQDSFNGGSAPATPGYLTPTDLTLMNALGFNVNYHALNCFAAGTRILARHGEVAVEHLAVGDMVVLATGGTASIIWIGQRSIDSANHPRKSEILPVLITADAIEPGMPARDLLLSPDHALFLDGHLIPAKALLNGNSIRQIERASITYYHIELAAHGVVLAEGLPAETYLDTGNRTAFENAGIAVSLHPDFATPDQQDVRLQKSCAPLVESGPVVEQVRARILARSVIASTDNPELHILILANGDAVIRSRAAIPALRSTDPRDRRRLGVKVASLTIDDQPISLTDPALTQGWHDAEADGRWTNGRAIIPASLHRGGVIALTLAARLSYPRSRVA